MAFIPVPDAAKVTIYGHTGARTWTLNLWFAMPGFDAGDMENLGDYLETWLEDELAPQLAADTNFDQIVIYDMSAADGNKYVADIDIAGTSAGALTPVSTACVVSFYGSARGKWNQGRNYVTGFTEEAGDEKDMTQSKADGIRDAYRALQTDLPSGWTWVVVSRVFNKLPRAVGVYAPIVSCIVRNLVYGTQKRRLRKT
jgi:hypothetical protein